MPTLDWIGKKAVLKHHKDVPYRLLEPVLELSHGESESGNLIVQGDNLDALKALLPRYAGKVRCIYIDPPYNTGNEGWVYNDNVNSPEISKWLDETVGKEAEDLSRHDKWLCMMYPRLVLLRKLLSEDGAIFVSIDDNEVSKLRILMDEIFGTGNFVTTIAWQKIYTLKNSAQHFSEMHDYIVTYAFNKKHWTRNLLPRKASSDENYSNPDNDPRGAWTTNALQSRNYYSKGTYKITCPGGRVIPGPPKGTYWRIEEAKLWQLHKDNRVWWGNDGNNSPRIKKFLSEAKDGIVPSTWWEHKFAGTNSGAKTELRKILGDFEEELFNTPKPWQLIQRIIQIATDSDSIILDSFAGSGATAHAVLKQNTLDGGNRKFILVELDKTVSETITAKRVEKIVGGYSYTGKISDELFRQKLSPTSIKKSVSFFEEIEAIESEQEDKYTRFKREVVDNHLVLHGIKEIDEEMPGFGSGFQFCQLSADPLFGSDGQIREDVSFRQLAEFVWFGETGCGFTDDARSPLIGIHEGRAIYLLYNGILKDRSVNGGNVLTSRVLSVLPEFDGPKVIYAAACRLGQPRLDKLDIQFKQTPYALEI